MHFFCNFVEMKVMKLLIGPIIVSLMVVSACVNPRPGDRSDDTAADTRAPWDDVEEGQAPPVSAPEMPEATIEPEETQDSTLREDPDTVNAVPLIGDVNLRSKNGLVEAFNDSNKYQYEAGERIGIKPITSIAEAYFTRRPLIKVETGEWYVIEPLTHSMPYLVPEAAELLETIGRNFQDSLKSKRLGNHKICVTSLLRSAHSVKKLRRVNRNATDSSTHQLGTTFDITYSHFAHGPQGVSDQQLKLVLAEVLRDLRAANKCMVKYEIKSPCFHITATGK